MASDTLAGFNLTSRNARGRLPLMTALMRLTQTQGTQVMTTATAIYRGITINVTKCEDIFDFGVGPSWSYEIDGHDRPMWSSSVSEADAIDQAKATIDQMTEAGHAWENAR
jgi:hypothetical protein